MEVSGKCFHSSRLAVCPKAGFHLLHPQPGHSLRTGRPKWLSEAMWLAKVMTMHPRSLLHPVFFSPALLAGCASLGQFLNLSGPPSYSYQVEWAHHGLPVPSFRKQVPGSESIF